MKKIIMILAIFIGGFTYAQSNGTDIELMIAAAKDQCEDQNNEEYACFKAKKTTDPHWTFNIPEIEGFTYEPGYIYTLKLNLSKSEEVQIDGTYAKYTLVEVLAKKAN